MERLKTIKGVGTTTGTDTYVVTLSIGYIQLVTEGIYIIKFGNTNTGASTLNINSIGVKSIKKNNGAALQANDIQEGKYHILIFDGTNFNIIDVQGGNKAVRIGNRFFDTLTAARDAAQAGDTIVVPEGTYDENDLLNGINATANWHFEEGAIIDSTTGDQTKAIFQTISTGGGYQGKITGLGIFKKATDASFKGIVNLNNAADDIYFEALSMDGKGNTAIWVDNGKLLTRVKENISSSNGVAVFTDGGEIVLYTDEVIETAAQCLWASVGSIIAYIRKIETAGPAIRVDSGATLRIFNFSLIKSGDASAISGSGNLYLSGRRIENNSSSNFLLSGAGTYHVTEIENLNGRIYSSGSGSLVLEFIDCNIIGNKDDFMISLAVAGTLKLRNSTVKNKNIGAAAHVLQKRNGTLILDNVTLVTAGTGDSINATDAQDVIVYQGVANKAVNANIRQKINSLIIDPDVE